MELLNKKAIAINGEEFLLKDHFSPSDFVDKEGSPFVKHDPLLRVAKKVLGITGKSVQIIQPPNKANEWSATAVVTYKFKGDITFASSAEARNSNLEDNMKPYSTAMAETRASARALRFALGVDVCSADEIGKARNIDDDSINDGPAEDSQIRLIQRFVEKGIKLDKVLSIGKVDTLEELTFGEAVELIKKLTRLQNRKKG